jgi:queuine tRNA-ribosyltransferase
LLDFRIDARAAGSRARAGTLRTQHDEVPTPVFMPVGTHAAVPAQTPRTLEDAGARILLANTYHLLLRPGAEAFRRLGGIHRFMGWRHSVLTDSGGYQIFSLPHARRITEEGASFRSYVDGRTILLSPESSIETQKAIGSDVMMALDQCVPSTCDEATARAALGLTHRWAARSLAARGDTKQALFAIVQGALFPHLRRESALRLAEMPFDGYAIGGLAVGEEKHAREDACEATTTHMPAARPRYLMGVGTPLDILEAVHRGVDMFDCIIPTQVAKRGGAFTSRGYLQLRRGVYRADERPLDPDCECPACASVSRAYLHHLTKAQEPLGWQLVGQHNLRFYHRLVREIRDAIVAGTFADLYAQRRVLLAGDDPEHPAAPSRVRSRARPRLGDYAVHEAPEGFASILHVPSGQVMHARTPPMDEARSLYVEQSRMGERLRLGAGEAPDDVPPLVVWDVGLGAAANAMAAVLAYEAAAAAGPVRGLRVVSFENDLDSLRLALHHDRLFPYLRHGGPATVLRSGHWRSKAHPALQWTLEPGDFFERLASAPRPDVVFYDAWSGDAHAAAWTLDAFRRLAAAFGSRPVELFTYSASTAARAALLAAGLWVAKGEPTTGRPESTIALSPAAAVGTRHPLLGRDWLARWERSQARYPSDVGEADRDAFDPLVRRHPQFSGGTLPSPQGLDPTRS